MCISVLVWRRERFKFLCWKSNPVVVNVTSDLSRLLSLRKIKGEFVSAFGQRFEQQEIMISREESYWPQDLSLEAGCT